LFLAFKKDNEGNWIADSAYNIGLQDVKFNIPENIGAIKVGYENDNYFVSKGEITSGKLRIDSGFKVYLLPNKKLKVENLKGKSFDLLE